MARWHPLTSALRHLLTPPPTPSNCPRSPTPPAPSDILLADVQHDPSHLRSYLLTSEGGALFAQLIKVGGWVWWGVQALLGAAPPLPLCFMGPRLVPTVASALSLLHPLPLPSPACR